MSTGIPLRAREARVVAQGKINLFLRVLGREVGGYHSIETLFLRVELGDVVRVRVGGGAERTIDCHGPCVPPEGLGAVEQNLAYRAAVAYAEAAGWPDGFSIDVEKRLPVGGGLGGGSADAGAVLRVLNALAPEPLGPATLHEIASQLGADVPFLTGESACALAWGHGERLLELRPPPPRTVELLVPPFGVSTKWAYEQLAASRPDPFRPQPALHRVADLCSWAYLAAAAANDLEAVVAERYPEIGACAAALRERGALIAMMSGSGSVVFGVFDGAPPDAVGTFDERAGTASARVTRLTTRTAARVVGVERIE